MGDRCYVEVMVHPEDIVPFEKMALDFGFYRSGMDVDGVHYIDEDANYAHCDLLQDVASNGIRFHGWHTDGGDYNGCAFCGIDDVYSEACISRIGFVIVDLDGNGDVSESDLRDAREYLWTTAKVETEIKEWIAAHPDWKLPGEEGAA